MQKGVETNGGGRLFEEMQFRLKLLLLQFRQFCMQIKDLQDKFTIYIVDNNDQLHQWYTGIYNYNIIR